MKTSFPNPAACGRPAPAGPAPVGARSLAQPCGVGSRRPRAPGVLRRRLPARVRAGSSRCPRGRAASHPTTCGRGRQTLCPRAARRGKSGCSRTRTRGARDRLREAAGAGERSATRPRGSASRPEPPTTRHGDPASGSKQSPSKSGRGSPGRDGTGVGAGIQLGRRDGSPPGLDVKVFSLLSENFAQAPFTCCADLSRPALRPLLQPPGPRSTRPRAGDARGASAQKGRPRARAAPYIRGGRRLRGARSGGAAFEVLAAAAFILSVKLKKITRNKGCFGIVRIVRSYQS